MRKADDRELPWREALRTGLVTANVLMGCFHLHRSWSQSSSYSGRRTSTGSRFCGASLRTKP